jgi:hypothetical protein
VFRTDPHDMLPRWFGCGRIWRPEREQRTQSVDGNEIDAAQVDDQYAAVPHQPSGVRAHVVYVGRVDLAADGDHGEFGIDPDPNTGSAAIEECRAVSRWRMVNVIVSSSHVKAFASFAPSGGMAEHIKGDLETQTPSEARRKGCFANPRMESTPHLRSALSFCGCTLSTPFFWSGFHPVRSRNAGSREPPLLVSVSGGDLGRRGSRRLAGQIRPANRPMFTSPREHQIADL